MPVTYDLIKTVTVGSGGSTTIDFTNIPNTYTDLYIRMSARGTQSQNYTAVFVYFDGGTTAVTRYIAGDGSTPAAGTSSTFFGDFAGATAQATQFGVGILYLPSYAETRAKSYFTNTNVPNNANPAWQELWAGYYSGTLAVANLTLTASPNSFVEHSSASLYGVKKS